jgi:hypothetical protein
MNTLFVILGVLVLLYALAEAKTSRADGTLLRVHPIRRVLLAIMPTRAESLVLFDGAADATRLTAFLEGPNAGGAHITHLTVAAANIALAATPKMNRFTAGGRLYSRNKRCVSFSLKRARLDKEAAISTVKLDMKDHETLAGLVARIDGGVKVERSGTKTRTDREVDFFNALPRPALRAGVRAFRWLDDHNLLPASFIDGDPLFTSIFIANLGSLGMGAGYHHLFEYGSCSLFIMVGKVEERVVVRDGIAVVCPILPVRFTYDERIEDGLNAKAGIERFIAVLEDPERWLAGPMWPRQDDDVSFETNCGPTR